MSSVKIPIQKLSCYVDEAGQDPTSGFFVVVAVVSEGEQDALRKKLEQLEKTTGTNRKKWHKVRHANRLRYLGLLLEQKMIAGEVYVAHYRKPLPYFFPMLEVIEKAIKAAARKPYRASIYVDGIDRYKAHQLTNALRERGVSLRIVKSRRDESEPFIRLADMWAGCIRDSLLKHSDTQDLFKRAKEERYLKDIKES